MDWQVFIDKRVKILMNFPFFGHISDASGYLGGYHVKSVVWAYFIRRKKTFLQIKSP